MVSFEEKKEKTYTVYSCVRTGAKNGPARIRGNRTEPAVFVYLQRDSFSTPWMVFRRNIP